jgi:hypothetical protein
MKKTLYKPETDDTNVNLYVNEVCGTNILFCSNTNCSCDYRCR